jgi:hypothetical protein
MVAWHPDRLDDGPSFVRELSLVSGVQLRTWELTLPCCRNVTIKGEVSIDLKRHRTVTSCLQLGSILGAVCARLHCKSSVPMTKPYDTLSYCVSRQEVGYHGNAQPRTTRCLLPSIIRTKCQCGVFAFDTNVTPSRCIVPG